MTSHTMGNNQEGTTCGGYRTTVARGQRVVELPCGHVTHVRYMVNTVRRSGAQAPRLCGARSCTACHGRREALKVAVQADPRPRVTAVGLGGIPDKGEDGRRHELWYPWDQDTLWIAGPLDDVPLKDLEQCFTAVVKVEPRFVTATAKLLSTCSTSSITPWESIGRADNRRRRTCSWGALKCGISSRLHCTCKTAG